MNIQELSEGIEALLRDMYPPKEVDNLKCKRCYAVKECLLKPQLKEICRGPWDSKTDRLKHIQKLLIPHP